MPAKRTKTLLQYLCLYVSESALWGVEHLPSFQSKHAVLLCSALPGHGGCGIDCLGLVFIPMCSKFAMVIVH